MGQPFISIFARNVASIFRQTFTAFASNADVETVQRLIRLQKTWRNHVPLNSAGKPTSAGGPIFPTVALAPMEDLIAEWEQNQRESQVKKEEAVPPVVNVQPADTVPHPLPLYSLLEMMNMMISMKTQQISFLTSAGHHPQVAASQAQMASLTQLLHYIQNPHLLPNPETQVQISRQIHHLFTMEMPNAPIPMETVHQPMHQPIHPSRMTMIDHSPIIPTESRKRSRSPSLPLELEVRIPVPDVDFSTDGILEKHPGMHRLIYDGLGLQCKQCALRFPNSVVGKEKMDAHLDMHFRQNRSMKQGKDESRDWYVLQHVWEQPERGDVRQETTEQVVIDPHSLKPVKAPSEGSFKCAICRDGFAKFWDDDEEEWMLRDAVEWNSKVLFSNTS